MTITGRRVLVTGGAGFIGSHVVEALVAGGNHVTVIDNLFLGSEENLAAVRRSAPDSVAFYREDAADAAALAAVVDREHPDLVFNLATKALLYSFFNPTGACRVNVELALNVCELVRTGAVGRLVHVSSSEVYGSAVDEIMDEDHPLLAETTYAAGKAAADLVVASYVRMFGIDAVIARPFNNYGPRQGATHLGAVIPVTISRILEGLQPVVQGDGSQTRDFIYVADTVAALLALAGSGIGDAEVFNIGSGVETSISSVVRTVCDVLGYDGPVVCEPARPADVLRHRADVTRYRARFGELATTSLADGIARTVASWRS